MSKQKQKEYFDELWFGVKEHLSGFMATGNAKELHQMRVDIKKLRAFFMLAGVHQNRLKRHFKPVREVFKHAGLIRDAHNNLEMSHNYHVDDADFKETQQKLILEQTDVFRNNADQYLKNIKRARKAIEKEIELADKKHIFKFFHEGLKDIAEQLAVSLTDDELHANRRMIKTLVYNNRITPKKVEKKLHFDHEYLEKLQSSIGDWHDTVVAINTLGDTAPKPVLTKIKSRNTRLRKNITKLTDDFLHKATSAPEQEVQPEKTAK